MAWFWRTGSTTITPGVFAPISRALNQQTDTLTVVLVFPNPDHVLRPNQFAQVRADLQQEESALLVPVTAVITLQGTQSVLLVDAESKVVQRTITTSAREGDSYVVSGGLHPGDRVILEGKDKVQPGDVVKVQTVEPHTSSHHRRRGRGGTVKISYFFIDRPVFAIVISAVIFIAGALSLLHLPVNEYPNITPPVVEVKAAYPGAPAEMVEKVIAIPIEENVNGAKNMISMASRSSNDGTYSLECTFRPGSDPDIDAVEVQNRVLQSQDSLPRYVIDNGVIVGKRTPTTLMIISVYSPHRTYDSLFLSNYAQIHVIDPVTRTPGVGDYDQHGHDFAMRLWVKPDRMAALGITAGDVRDAIEAQNQETPTGQIGAPPSAPGTNLQFNVVANNEITRPEVYNDMIVRHAADGSVLRLRDFGHAAMGSRNYSTFTSLNGLPVTSIVLYQLPDANALQVERAVKNTMDELAKNFPPDVTYAITMDSTKFIVASIKEVLITLVIAIVLVFFVVYLFLGSLRATLIPVLAVPVSLVGTLAVYAVLGFSINLLTLFGLVLAIGLVVDDAIIVVEASERHLEEGAEPVEAARLAMKDVSRAVIAIALVLSFVFIPIAFIPGITGSLYRQFALTLAASILLSALVALSLTPAFAPCC